MAISHAWKFDLPITGLDAIAGAGSDFVIGLDTGFSQLTVQRQDVGTFIFYLERRYIDKPDRS